MLEVRSLAIPDVKLIKTNRFSGGRGYFCETFRRPAFAEQGIVCDFLQDNQSCSDRIGTVRGLHFQRPPFALAKLIRVLSGAIFDVAVDLRRFSPSFGKHVAIELDSESGEQLLVPSGLAHGFCTLQPRTIVFYKVDQVYAPGLARRGRSVPRLQAITSEQYPTPARRPQNSCLDSSKAERAFGVRLAPWRSSLEACLDQLAVEGRRAC